MFISDTLSSIGIDNFRSMIPEKYYSLLQDEELVFTLVREADGSADVGFAITKEHNSWLEIIWIETMQGYKNDASIADFIRYIIRLARRSGRFEGVVVQIHESESTPRTFDILAMAGMETQICPNNIYRLVLGDIGTDKLSKGAGTFLADADPAMIRTVEEAIRRDKRGVPVALPIPVDDYIKDLSLVYAKSPEKAGVLLFSEVRDCLVFELAYSTTPTVLRSMLGAALSRANELFPPDKEILLPIVVNGSVKLINYLIPNAQCGKVIEATVRFKGSSGGPSVRPES